MAVFGGPKKRQHHLAAVRVPGQDQVDGLGQGVHEIRRVGDDDAVVSVRSDVQEPPQPGRSRARAHHPARAP